MHAVGRRRGDGRRSHVQATTRDRPASLAPGRVERGFSPQAIGGPDRLGGADIGDVATWDGWRYLAVVLDAFRRRVPGWAMAEQRRAELVIDALALTQRH